MYLSDLELINMPIKLTCRISKAPLNDFVLREIPCMDVPFFHLLLRFVCCNRIGYILANMAGTLRNEAWQIGKNKIVFPLSNHRIIKQH